MVADFIKRGLINRVLIVDDTPLVCSEIGEMLDKRNIRHMSLASEIGMNDAIRDFDPKLILLDIRLKDSDAFEVMKNSLAGRYRGVVCLISGSPLDYIMDAAAIGTGLGLWLGTSLRKPIAQGDLDEALRTASIMLSGRSIRKRLKHLSKPYGYESRLTLRHALNNDMLEVWYQPTYLLSTENVAGAEALIRGRINGQIIMPEELFRESSRQDYIDLTMFVLRSVIGDFRVLAEHGIYLKPSINVPSSFLAEGDPASLVRRTSKEAWWPGMIFEITEDEALDSLTAFNQVALQLRLYAVELSIDDFGAGHSSLARLRDLPFSELKLDRSFVDGCSSDSIKLAICKNVLALGAELGCLTVAEGIENEADLLVLREFGCDKVQGYLFARPMLFADFLRMLLPAPVLRSGMSEP